jgi:hypothetical protein
MKKGTGETGCLFSCSVTVNGQLVLFKPAQ